MTQWWILPVLFDCVYYGAISDEKEYMSVKEGANAEIEIHPRFEILSFEKSFRPIITVEVFL